MKVRITITREVWACFLSDGKFQREETEHVFGEYEMRSSRVNIDVTAIAEKLAGRADVVGLAIEYIDESGSTAPTVPATKAGR